MTRELWGRVMKGQSLKDIRIPEALGIAGHVFCSGRTLMLGDAYNDPRFNPEIDRQSGFRTRSIIATPLRHLSGPVLGVLQVLDRAVDAFTVDDQRPGRGRRARRWPRCSTTCCWWRSCSGAGTSWPAA